MTRRVRLARLRPNPHPPSGFFLSAFQRVIFAYPRLLSRSSRRPSRAISPLHSHLVFLRHSKSDSGCSVPYVPTSCDRRQIKCSQTRSRDEGCWIGFTQVNSIEYTAYMCLIIAGMTGTSLATRPVDEHVGDCVCLSGYFSTSMSIGYIAAKP